MIDRFLVKILKCKTSSLPNLIIKKIDEFAHEKYDVIKDKQYTFFKLRGGNKAKSIMLSAHIDTVHVDLPKEIKEEETINGLTIFSPEGIGGDDRAGVYAILKIVERLAKYEYVFPKYLLFTNYEEKGLIGSKKFVEDFKSKIKVDNIFNFDADRDKAVFLSDMSDDVFKAYIYKYFGTDGEGHPCDISVLQRAFTNSAVNIGVGFENWHRLDEKINIDELNSQIYKSTKAIARILKERVA